MTAPYLLISRFALEAGKSHEVLATLGETPHLRHYCDEDNHELVQLRALQSPLDFAALEQQLDADLASLTPHLTQDVRRELLRFVESPKPCVEPLPRTDFLQLRHIEVPPHRIPAYREWREATIFDVVRSSPPVEVFLAYHSLVSTQPGVMFLSGYSCPAAEYDAVFSSERYRDIVQQAGDAYIAGGAEGLYTKTYARAGLVIA